MVSNHCPLQENGARAYLANLYDAYLVERANATSSAGQTLGASKRAAGGRQGGRAGRTNRGGRGSRNDQNKYKCVILRFCLQHLAELSSRIMEL